MATREDAGEIARLLHIMHAEGGMLPLDEECARETFELAFSQQGGIIGVIGPPDDIQGMIYLLITRFWYTRDYHLEEIFNFVRPDARQGTLHAEDLIKFAKRSAEQVDLPLVIGVLTSKRMESKVRLYRRVLGAPAGAFFVHNAKGWREAPTNENFWGKAIKRRRRRRGE